MEYYLITSKSDDFGRCQNAVYYGDINKIKKYIYEYKKIPKTHYIVLKKYFEDINDCDYEDFGYTLKEYLEEYY